MEEAEKEYEEVVREDEVQREKEKRAALEGKDSDVSVTAVSLGAISCENTKRGKKDNSADFIRSNSAQNLETEQQINVSDLEANIQANLQAKID